MAQRRLAVTAVLGLALGCLLIMTGIPQRFTIVSPGTLTSHHQGGEGCQDCHAMGEGQMFDWLNASIHPTQVSDQSERCLKCHQELSDNGMFAHGLAPESLAQLTDEIDAQSKVSSQSLLLQMARVAQPAAGQELACMTCHTEHRGEDFNMTAMVDRKCQLCHSQTFTSFNQGHPEITQYWYPRRIRIHFNHASHELVHAANFARTTPGHEDTSQEPASVMRCTDCHFADETGKSMHTRGYETSCAHCHDHQITDHEMDPLVVLRWAEPQSPDEEVASVATPFMRLLMPTGGTSPTEGAEALPRNIETTLGLLVSDLLHRNRPGLEKRLQVSLGSDADLENVQQLAATLTNFDLTTADRQRLLTLIASEPTTAIELPETNAAEEDSPGPQTAWSLERSDKVWTLVYRPTGHADPLMKACLELGARHVQAEALAGADEGESPLSSVFREWTKPTFAGRCLKCHTVEADTEGRLQITWLAERPRSDSHGLTEFVHGPHLTLGSQATCATCHPVVPEHDLEFFKPEFIQRDNTISIDAHAQDSSGFVSLGKAVCADCHQPDRAGESCLTCHKYHVLTQPMTPIR